MVFFASRQLLRNLRRSVAILGGLTLSVAIGVATLLYVSGSAAGLTETALRAVSADLVAHGTNDHVDAGKISSAYRDQEGVSTAEPLVAADFASLTAIGAPDAALSGRVFATTGAFVDRFPFIVTTEGAFAADGILISQAIASRLDVHPGDRVSLAISGTAKPYRVTGILDSAAAEPLFASGDPNFEGEFSVVPDVVVMPYELYRADSVTLISPTSPTAKSPADAQVYVHLDRAQFTGDPSAAQKQIDAVARGLERQDTGQVKITNNDDSALKRAKQDVLGAKVLFVFLGLPGIAVAGFLAYAASQVFRDESRREVGLLRARGAGPRQVYAAAALSAMVLGLAGSALGTALGAAAASLAVGSASLTAPRLANAAVLAVPTALVVSFLAIIVPTVLGLRRDITDERRLIHRTGGTPFWERFGLDFASLGAATLFLGITYLAGGFKPTTAEGQAVSLAFYVFLGPLFLWVGLTLVLLRYLRRVLPLVTGQVGRVLPLAGFGGLAAKDLARRPQLASVVTSAVALAIAFGISLLAFTNTYAQERTRDSRFVVGSDIRVTLSSAGQSAPATVEPALSQQSVTSYSGFMRDTNALIGSERQTMYGIDVPSFRITAYLPDSFFANGSATRTLDALQGTPNGVLVSREEATGFNIQVGDALFVRLSSTDPSGYQDVELKVVGITNYFPTSSQDSDFIMNRSAMIQAAGRVDGRNDVYLVTVSGHQSLAASRAIRAALPAGTVAKFEDLQTAAKVDESSLTNLNAAGLGGIQQTFGYALVGGAMFAFVATLISTRRKDLSTMRALGASLGQVRVFVAVQAATVIAAALAVGIPVGVMLGWVQVRLLAVIFPIPIDHAVLVSTSSLLFVGGALLAVVVALLAASVAIAGTSVGATLRDQ
jgi:putative ABC transport system permease protein